MTDVEEDLFEISYALVDELLKENPSKKRILSLKKRYDELLKTKE